MPEGDKTEKRGSHIKAAPTGNTPISTRAVGNLGVEDVRLLLEAVNTTAAATLAVAETTRLHAAGCQLGGVAHSCTTTLGVIERARELGGEALVISERVLSITLEQWEAISEERLRELDGVLSRIVTRACIEAITWGTISSIIRDELAAFGFNFTPAMNFSAKRLPGDWVRVADAEVGDLARIRAVGAASRGELGSQWHLDEMIRVVQRLMELRGFKA